MWDRSVLESEKIIGGADFSEMGRTDAKTDDIPEKLEDGSQPEKRRLFVKSQEMAKTQNEIGEMEVQNQKPVLRGVTMALIGSIFQQVAQGQKVAFQHHAKPGIVDGCVELFYCFSDGRELQSIRIDDGQEVVAVKLLPKNLQTNSLNIEEKHRDRQCQNQNSKKHAIPQLKMGNISSRKSGCSIHDGARRFHQIGYSGNGIEPGQDHSDITKRKEIDSHQTG